ncbi:hypothetical protein [Legionella fallonii]|uniref:Uncharacterized protein n=1 Tax=Legionella fallonii LLAP-10 TaxID=1212491 RepID=A0A098G8R4_9GAMM|nr:hypothetical protein [Legionella fallonii]CEG58389.1 conserved protein of unknown function [Legionella fallonii LLAP-10]
MVAPTKEETNDFINKNKSFFTTPLTEKGQKEFQQFYTNANAIAKIADYSQQLMAILYKHGQQLNEDSVTPVVYAWRKGDFAPALEHEEVRQFIMDNKDHPALVMWANKKSVIEANKSEIQKQETPLPIPKEPKTLADLREKFLQMNKEDFDYVFSSADTIAHSEGITMNRRLAGQGVTGDLFKTQDDFNSWKQDIITAKNQQTQTKTKTQTKIERQETSLSATEKSKILAGFREKFLQMSKEGFDQVFDISDTVVRDGGITMNRRLAGQGVTGDLFKTQDDFNDWMQEIITAKNQQTQAQEDVHGELQRLRQGQQPKPQPVVLNKHHQEFNKAIDVLKQKMEEFKKNPDFEEDPKLQKAFNAANKLHNKLERAGNDYFRKEPSEAAYDKFARSCKSHINEARAVLDEHRGWKKILINVVAIIATAGIGYAIAAGINMAMNKGKFTFFSTDSSLKLDSIEEHLENKGNKSSPAA